MRKAAKKQNRGGIGGYRQRQQPKTGQGRLISAVFDKFDGLTDTGRIIGVPNQRVSNWRHREHVSMDSLGMVVRALYPEAASESVDAYYIFNYEEMSVLFGYSPEWESVVKLANLMPHVEAWVLKGTPPKTFEELCGTEQLQASDIHFGG